MIGPLLAQVHLPALTMFLQPSQFRPLSLKHYSLSSLPLRTPNLPNQGQELEELRAVLCPERWTSVRNLRNARKIGLTVLKHAAYLEMIAEWSMKHGAAGLLPNAMRHFFFWCLLTFRIVPAASIKYDLMMPYFSALPTLF